VSQEDEETAEIINIMKKVSYIKEYRWTSLYARDRDSKNMLEYSEFAY